MHGYRRRDGLYDVEGRLRDVKTRDLPLKPPGVPVPANVTVPACRSVTGANLQRPARGHGTRSITLGDGSVNPSLR